MRIPDDVLGVLSAMEFHGDIAVISEQLDRKLYVAVNKVLVELGGKWNRRRKGHVFAEEPARLVDRAILTGVVSTRAELGYFPTPGPVARLLVERVGLRPRDFVLEPSAGDGALLEHLKPRGPARVIAVELNERRCGELRETGLADRVVQGDFLRLEDHEIYGHSAPFLGFDSIVMNPPFARGQDVDHVRRAFGLLSLHGRLASVMSAGITFRRDRKTTEFRSWLKERHGTIEPLPDGAFKDSGTAVRTVLVTARR